METKLNFLNCVTLTIAYAWDIWDINVLLLQMKTRKALEVGVLPRGGSWEARSAADMRATVG